VLHTIQPVTWYFFTGKNLGGLGNGGMVVSNNKHLINEIEKLRDPESNSKNLIYSKRTPCYLDAIQTAFLKPKLKVIDKWIGLIRQNAKLYNELLNGNNIILPKENKNCKHTYYSYVIRLKKRDKLRRFLQKHKVNTMIEYEVPLHLNNTFKYLGHKKGDFPVVEKCSKEILSLPISPFLMQEEIKKICMLIKKIVLKQK
jgi:dTDP-4-amino-4,6-dideoxygalactose transaminase